MTRLVTITFMILASAALTFSPESRPVTELDPGCIVQPEVIEACEQGGGRFDYKLCSCVGGN